MKRQKRGFEKLKGETVKKIDQSCINIVRIVCESGKIFEIDCDEQHFNIGILQCKEGINNV